MKIATFIKLGVVVLSLTGAGGCFASEPHVSDQPLSAGFAGAANLEPVGNSDTDQRHLPELDAVILMLLGLVGLGLSRRSVSEAE